VRLVTSVACALAALCVPAFAQNAPLPAPSATPSPATAAQLLPKHHITDATRDSVSHLPIIDIVPIYTQLAPFTTAAQKKGFDPADVGGTIQIPITRALSFSFDRNVDGLYNQAPENVIGSNPNSLNRDVALVERLDYQYRQFVFEGGLSFRHRLDGSGVSGAPYPYTISSNEWHMGYLSATYTTNPIRALLNSRFIVGLTGEEQPVDHHVAVLNRTTHLVTYIDEHPNQNRYYESTQLVAIVIPIDPRHGLTIGAKDSWGAGAYWENAPFPYRYTGTVVLSATKKFTNFFSLSVRASNVHAVEQGYPYPVPNATHNEVFDVLADFHLDTNRFLLK
jgi:hypothetical protein